VAKVKILIMGLPGSGKTYLAEKLQAHLRCAWYNADKVRTMASDWDFTPEGRIRQANRMRNLADFESRNGRVVIVDFVCPTEETRANFAADMVIWMDTIDESRFEDTNKMFVQPSKFDFRVEKPLNDEEMEVLFNDIKRQLE
jgi:adenylylsulfate kinase